METRADVGVAVRSTVVAVHVEQPVVLIVVVVVTTNVQRNARSVVVAVVAMKSEPTDYWYAVPKECILS